MRYHAIYEMDTAFGDGIRNVIVLQGCATHCPDCHMHSITDFRVGHKLAPLIIGKFLRQFDDPILRGLTICGGDVFADAPFDNYSTCLRILKGLKTNYPDKDVWIFSCRSFESVKNTELMQYVDVYVEGKYKLEHGEHMRPYGLSGNQDIIRRSKEGEFYDSSGMAR